MYKWNKAISLLLVLVMILSLIGCGAETPVEESPVVQTEAPEEPATVSIMIPLEQSCADDNSVIKALREKTGVNVEITIVSPEDYETKINALTASGNLPDVFYLNWSQMEQYADAEAIIPLDDLVNNYGSEYLADESWVTTANLSRYNDKLYQIPYITWRFCNGLAIRTDWLAELGLEMPKTLDDYYEVLKAFKAKNPDTIPMGACFGYGQNGTTMAMLSPIFNAYGISLSYGNLVDGKVVPFIMHEEFLDAIEYCRKLYKEGLMEPDFATLPAMQCYEKLWVGTYGAMGLNPQAILQNWIGRYVEDPKPTFEFVALEGPDGEKGFEHQSLPIKKEGFVISATADNPEAAMKVLNYVHSDEGAYLLYYGIEGTHYEMVDGKVQYLEPYLSDITTHRMDGGFVYQTLTGKEHGPEYLQLNQNVRDTVTYMYENPVADGVTWSGTLAVQAELGSILDDILMKAMANLIVADGDIEALAAEYTQSWLEAGGERWIEEATAAYEASK